MLYRFWRTDTANASTMTLYPSVMGQYRDAYEYAMAPNWDNDGAAPIRPEVVHLAARLITGYGTTEHLVEVGPGRDGSLSFVWDDNCGNYIYLDVGPNDTVHLYRDIAGHPRWEGVSVAGDPRILEEISSAFRATGWLRPKTLVFSFSAGAHNTNRWWRPAAFR
jgi:hypothetical protein